MKVQEEGALVWDTPTILDLQGLAPATFSSEDPSQVRDSAGSGRDRTQRKPWPPSGPSDFS